MKRLPLLLALVIAVFALGQNLTTPKAEGRRLNVLFFGAPTSNGPGHDPITRYRVIKKHLGVEGVDFTYSEDPAEVFSKETLGEYDALLMYGNWEQNGTMPDEQQAALLDWVSEGGAFLPIHCASACYGKSSAFVELVGAKFRSHTSGVFAPKTVAQHPIVEGYKSFEAWDETYVHSDHNDDRKVLQVRGKEPWTWVREHGKGRVFYTASGHDHRVWDTPEFQDLIKRAVYWSVGSEKYGQLKKLNLPKLEQERVSLPGYRERKEITMAQKPLSPAESMKLAQVPAGFELSLFASEPDIVNPIYVGWDHRGRAFVIETIDYPNNIQKKDLGHDRITICEDTNGDGRADKFTRFAEKLSIPTSLV
ncbi:ThuA domain-containing protein, partial [Akkermansiaceae bacterium]|nr:ThuA domain-containing protein [Akkermansiaceae bacterium]